MSLFWIAAIYILAQYLPCWLLCYYPVWDRLRFPTRVTTPLLVCVMLVEAVLFGVSITQGGTGRIIEFTFIPVCLGLYLLCVKADPFRLLFLFVFTAAYSLIIRGVTLFTAAHLFRQSGSDFVSLQGAVIHLIYAGLTMPFMFVLLRRAKDQIFRTEAPRLWKTIWLVPALTIAVAIVYTGDLQADTVHSLRFLFARVAVPVSVLGVYFLLMSSLDTVRSYAAAEERNRRQEQMLALQRSRFTQIQHHMEQVRRARHDLRQHLNMIQAYLDSGDEESLRNYIDAYGTSLPKDNGKTYCKNYASDTIIRYYAEEAEQIGTVLHCRSDLPETLPIDEPEFCVLLGNLLENAVEACAELTDPQRYIRLHIHLDGYILAITVDNPCPKKPIMQGGRLISTKRGGFGVGTQSIRSIAEAHHGMALFEWEESEFRASVMLRVK